MKLQVTSPDGGYKPPKGTHDKGRIAEEPGEGKLSSPVLEQRWAGRLTHRLSQIVRPTLHLRLGKNQHQSVLTCLPSDRRYLDQAI